MENDWFIQGTGITWLSEAIVTDDQYWNNPWVKRLACALCKDTYQHIDAQPRSLEAPEPYGAGWGGRGDLVIVPFHGECGHSWDICFGFHKGETFSFVRVGAY